MKKYLATALLALTATFSLHAEIITYPIPKQLYYARHNDTYTVQVRQHGDTYWTDLYEYNVKVDMDTQSDATFVQFDFSGTIDIRVQKNNGIVQRAEIRPLSKDIKPKRNGNELTFTIDRPQYLSVEFDGDKLHNLHILANAIRTDRPDSTDAHVMYFGNGVHEPGNDAKEFRVPSNTTVYLEGGAVLKGRLNCDSTEHVKVLGHGMILEAGNGLSAYFAKDLLVDGPTVVNPRYNTLTVGTGENITIRNLKSFSSQGWGDGLDFYCCKHVLVEDCFLRNSDDCIAVYGHRWDFYGNTDDITVRHSTLWSDIAHAINIGTHGDTSHTGETIENLTFTDLDILEHDEDDPEYQGCLSINTGDHNLARHILFDHIRVERIEEGQLFHIRVMYNEKYNTGPGRSIQDVTFRNIDCLTTGTPLSVIKGYDEEHHVDGITFERITVNGKRIRSLDKLNIKTGEHVKGVSIR